MASTIAGRIQTLSAAKASLRSARGFRGGFASLDDGAAVQAAVFGARSARAGGYLVPRARAATTVPNVCCGSGLFWQRSCAAAAARALQALVFRPCARSETRLALRFVWTSSSLCCLAPAGTITSTADVITRLAERETARYVFLGRARRANAPAPAPGRAPRSPRRPAVETRAATPPQERSERGKRDRRSTTNVLPYASTPPTPLSADADSQKPEE